MPGHDPLCKYFRPAIHVMRKWMTASEAAKAPDASMPAMHRTINSKLRKMQNLASPADKRAINCNTCHRGSVDPMADTN